MRDRLYFVEQLSSYSWAFFIWPRLCWRRLFGSTTTGHCYTTRASRLALLVAKISGSIIGVDTRKITFRMVDVKDESGLVIDYRILYQDLAKAQLQATSGTAFQHMVKSITPGSRLPIYLAKKIAEFAPMDHPTLRSALTLVLVCQWYARHIHGERYTATLFLNSRSWFDAITKYADENGIDVIGVHPGWSLRAELRRIIPFIIMDLLRHLRYGSVRKSLLIGFFQRPSAAQGSQTRGQESDPLPQVAVDYIGHLNLGRPELHTNLFFWQQSTLPAKAITVMYSIPTAPLDGQQMAELEASDMQAIVLHPGATSIPSMPVLASRAQSKKQQTSNLSYLDNGPDSRWLERRIGEYQNLRSYWREVFAANHVKVYATYSSLVPAHCAVADALQELGGVTAVYRRSYEGESSPIHTVSADIMFDFSKTGVALQKGCKSVIGYHVVTGFLGDHRFEVLREQAGVVRHRLQQYGAKNILTFFDENSFEDPREGVDHQHVQENYHFLLEKVQTQSSLGLVLKPKSPSTLRSRLGPVTPLLDKALETGRCYVYEESGSFQGSYPPVAAALESDATLGLLSGGTAAIEAALAGVPTFLLDREGWSASPLYGLGVGQVVFNDWESLWNVLIQHWSAACWTSNRGAWTPILDDLDPFRDGRAAERMGTYIHWLIDGFKKGSSREAAMKNAAERYSSVWGDDMVTEVN